MPIFTFTNITFDSWILSRLLGWFIVTIACIYHSDLQSLQVFLCRLQSLATHRDHFVRRPSVCLSVSLSVCHTSSVTLSKAMFHRRLMHSSECCHYFVWVLPAKHIHFLWPLSVFVRPAGCVPVNPYCQSITWGICNSGGSNFMLQVRMIGGILFVLSVCLFVCLLSTLTLAITLEP